MIVSFVCAAFLWIPFLAVAEESALYFYLRHPEEFVIQDDTIALIEGGKLLVFCNISCLLDSNGTCPSRRTTKWTKSDETNSVRTESILEIQTLDRGSAGNYTCKYLQHSRTLLLDVLYPPTEAVIQGPRTFTKNSDLNLTCSADSNPAAKYWWTSNRYYESQKLSDGATIVMENVDKEDILVFCFAQNQMIPTVGGTVLSMPVIRQRYIILREPVYIQELPSEYTAYVGSSIDILCDAYGTPPPKVWWTKHSDEKFIRNSSRFIAYNVQPEFAGVYICNARNNYTSEIGRDTKTISISVKDVPKIEDADAGYRIATIVSAVLGWAIIIIIVVAIVLRHFRRKTRTKRYYRVEEPSIRLSSLLSSNSAVLPAQPTEHVHDDVSRLLPTGTSNGTAGSARLNIFSLLSEDTARKTAYKPDFEENGICGRY